MLSFALPTTMAGEAIATTIFSFRSTAALSKRQIEQDIVRKARHFLRRAAVAT